MDPLSVAASIVGILGASAQVLKLLTAFIKSANGAPKAAQDVLAEVADISACLWKLQSFLLGIETASATRTSLMMVEQIVVTLTSTVTTFSELEERLDAWTQAQWSALEKYKWAVREKSITQILVRLQTSKSSLHFMLTTLTCASMEEARASSKELYNLVQRVLESNEDISKRLNVLEMPCNGSHSFIGTTNGDADDDRDTIRPETDNTTLDSLGSFQTEDFSFTFDQDLQTSRVYTRTAGRQSNFSIESGAVQSISWSLISGISLSAVSNISVISLPISPQELWNGQHYSPDSHLQADTVTLNEPDESFWHHNEAVRIKEQNLRREEEKLRQIELKIQREINEKRKILLEREQQLRELEARLMREQG